MPLHWEKAKSMPSMRTAKGHSFYISSARSYSKRITHTRGRSPGDARTEEDRQKQVKIQLCGYSDKVSEYYARTGGEVFYGRTRETAERKAMNYLRRRLREDLEALSLPQLRQAYTHENPNGN